MNCTAFTAPVIASLNVRPYEDIYNTVSQCPNICQTLYGIGDVDLTGIGVIISISIQIFFSLLFFGFLFMDATFIPIFKPSHKPTAVTAWLKPHQQTCIYSSLLFTFTLSLATTIYQLMRETNGIYDSTVVFYNLDLTYTSFLIITLSCYEPFTRPKLFTLGFAVTGILAFISALYPIITLKDVNTTRACMDFSYRENLAWRSAAPLLLKEVAYEQLTPSTISIILFSALWVWLRRLLLHYRNGIGGYIQREKSLRLIKGLATVILVVVILLTGFMAFDMNQFIIERTGMDIFWHGKTGVNQMGIGQIGAPFAWAPLIVDMTYSATENIKKWWTVEPSKRETD